MSGNERVIVAAIIGGVFTVIASIVGGMFLLIPESEPSLEATLTRTSINRDDVFVEASENCEVVTDEVILISNSNASDSSFCNLGLDEVAINWVMLETFGADVEIQSGYAGVELNIGVGLFTETASGNWYAFCGLDTSNDVSAVFTATENPGEEGVLLGVSPARPDESYEMILEIDKEAQTLTCYANNNAIAELSVATIPDKTEIVFSRTINSYRAGESTGTTEIFDLFVLK